MLLPRELLDQVTLLHVQYRELSVQINRLANRQEITSQEILDEVVSRIKAQFAESDRAIETLEGTVEFEEDKSVKKEAEIHLAKIQEDFKIARASFRKLLLQASKGLQEYQYKKSLEAAFELQPTPPSTSLNSPSSPTLPNRPKSPSARSQNDSSLLTAANDVTLALKRTHLLLEQELEKSNLSLETLSHSSGTLQQLEHRYSAFDVLLNGSRRLIAELEQADKWDRWMIYGGLGLFASVCLWILYKRLLRGPLAILFWVFWKTVGLVPLGKGVSNVVYSTKEVVIPNVPEEVQTQLLSESNYDVPDESTEIWTDGINHDGVVGEEANIEEQIHSEHFEEVEVH